MSIPKVGTKDRIKVDLLTRPKGATVAEINRAVGHHAWSYINDTKRLFERCGGTPHWEGEGGQGRFWIISMPQSGIIAASRTPEYNIVKNAALRRYDGYRVAISRKRRNPEEIL